MYILHLRQGLLWAPACPHMVITQAHVCSCLASSAVRRVFAHNPAAGLMAFETYSSFQASLSLKNQPGLHPGKNRNVTSEVWWTNIEHERQESDFALLWQVSYGKLL